MIFLLHWHFTSQRLSIQDFMKIGWKELAFFRHIICLCFWLLEDSTDGVFYHMFSIFDFSLLILLTKRFKAYFHLFICISTNNMPKNTSKNHLEISFFCRLLGDSILGVCYRTFKRLVGALPVRIFYQFFLKNFEEEKGVTLSISF